MADLKKAFEQAVADSKNLPEKPDNMTLLKIYALYKQATAGDAGGDAPGMNAAVRAVVRTALGLGMRAHGVRGFMRSSSAIA